MKGFLPVTIFALALLGAGTADAQQQPATGQVGPAGQVAPAGTSGLRNLMIYCNTVPAPPADVDDWVRICDVWLNSEFAKTNSDRLTQRPQQQQRRSQGIPPEGVQPPTTNRRD